MELKLFWKTFGKMASSCKMSKLPFTILFFLFFPSLFYLLFFSPPLIFLPSAPPLPTLLNPCVYLFSLLLPPRREICRFAVPTIRLSRAGRRWRDDGVGASEHVMAEDEDDALTLRR
jgi:hypothetical protein